MEPPAATGFDRSLCRLYNPLLGGERRLNMLLMSATVWILIGVVVVIVAAVIGRKIKDRYY